jgi:hypothetical protein
MANLDAAQFTPILASGGSIPSPRLEQSMHHVRHLLASAIVLVATTALVGCGLAETAASGAAGAASEAAAAKQAKQQGDAAVQQIEATQQQATEQRDSAIEQATK